MHAFEFVRAVDASHSVTVELPPDAPVGMAKIIVMFPDRPADALIPPLPLANIAAFTAWLETQPPTGRSGEDIDRQIRAERDSWGD